MILEEKEHKMIMDQIHKHFYTKKDIDYLQLLMHRKVV